jgi:hypothetical protein
MIYQIRLGDTVDVMIDDEMTEQRPTPEVAADYLTRIAQTALGTWLAMPSETVVVGPDEA